MGIFGRIGTYVGEQVEQRKRSAEQNKKERNELDTVRKAALKEERIRTAPSFAKQQVQMELKQKLAAAKSGRTGMFGGMNLGGIPNRAHDIGQQSSAGFNVDYSKMFGGYGDKKNKKAKPEIYGSSGGFGQTITGFSRDYDLLRGSQPQKTKALKTKHKKNTGKTIVIKL